MNILLKLIIYFYLLGEREDEEGQGRESKGLRGMYRHGPLQASAVASKWVSKACKDGLV